MIVNPNEFQAMIMSCDKKENKFDLDINYSTILSVDYVTLLSKKCDKEKVKKKMLILTLLYTLTTCIAR